MTREELKALGEKIEPQGDLISRQDTLNAIIKRLGIKDESYLLEAERAIYQQILAMPSFQPDIEAIRREIETEMNLCRMNGMVSKGYKGKILEEVIGIIDKHMETMRDATPEERQSVDDYMDSISTTVDLEAIRQEIEKLEKPISTIDLHNGSWNDAIHSVLYIIDKHMKGDAE